MYWADRRTVTVEQNVKFDEGSVLVPATVTLEGENGEREHAPSTLIVVPTPTTQPQDLSVTSTGSNEHEAPPPIEAESTSLVQDPLGTNFIRDPKPEPPTPTTSAQPNRPQQSRKPSAYVKQLQSGEAITHNVRRYAGIPKGLQAPTSAPVQEESTNVAEIESALAAAISDAEGMDPLTLEECQSRSDWPKWDEAIKVKLEALKKAGTW